MPEITYRCKGRIVTKITFEKRLAQQKSGEKRRKTAITSIPSEEMMDHNALSYVEEQNITGGPRIVQLEILGQQLCVSCKEALSLENIQNKTGGGLCSQLFARCRSVCFS
jgi:hypothetical protein